MDDGIIINGQYYRVPLIDHLIKEIVKITTEKVVAQFEELKREEPEKNYTVGEIAKLTNKSPRTVSRHIRMKILEGHKVGKAWLITQTAYDNYKLNRYDF